MEKQVKFYWIAIAIAIMIGSAWCLYGWLLSFLDNSNKCFGSILLTHIAFFVFFVCMILTSYKVFVLKSRIAAEEKQKADEFERKKVWEQFQYDLHKSEREEKNTYERIEKIIDKLDNKEFIDNNALKNDFDLLRSEFKELKLKKDKHLFVEIKNKNEHNSNNNNTE